MRRRYSSLVLLVSLLRSSVSHDAHNGDLSSCCNLLSTSPDGIVADVITCTNNSNTRAYSTLLESISQEPSLKITIITRATADVQDYASYSYLVQSIYASINGYTMLPLWGDSPRRDYAYHRKLVPLLEVIQSDNSNADYTAWIDADLIPLDLKYRIEQVAAAHKSAHILMSSDVSSIGNTGFIIVKGNSRWAKAFIEEWLAQMDTPGVDTEQLGLDVLYRKRGFVELSAKVAILPPHVLNSIAAPMGQQLLQHKVLHLAAESSAYRASVFKAAAAEACAALLDERRPAHQLGISREYLQDTARSVYGEAMRRIERDILQGPHKVSTQALSEYRTSASKYSYATNYANDYHETEHTLQTRLRAHTVVDNLTVCRLHIIMSHAFQEGVVEMMVPLPANRYQQLRAGVVRHSQVAKLSQTTRSEISQLLESARWAKLRSFINQNLADLLIILNAYVTYISTILQSDSTDCRACVGEVRSPQHSGHNSQSAFAQHNADHHIQIPELTDRQLDCMHCDDLQHWQDLPEMLKLSAELSYELLCQLPAGISATTAAQKNSSDSARSGAVDIFSVDLRPVGQQGDSNSGTSQGIIAPKLWLEVRQELESSMEFTLEMLQQVVHPSQLGIIKRMKADYAKLH